MPLESEATPSGSVCTTIRNPVVDVRVVTLVTLPQALNPHSNRHAQVRHCAMHHISYHMIDCGKFEGKVLKILLSR